MSASEYMGNSEMAAHMRTMHGQDSSLSDADDYRTAGNMQARQSTVRSHNAQHAAGSVPVGHSHTEPGWAPVSQ